MKTVAAGVAALLLAHSTAVASSSRNEATLTLNPHGTYTVQVQMPGVGVRPFTFDTGASYSSIDTSIAKEADATFLKSVRVRFPNGELRPGTIVKVPSLTIGHCTLKNVEMVATQISGPQVLGVSTIEQIFPLTMSADHLTFHCPAH